MQVVDDVLHEIHADNIPKIIVYNKVDKIDKPFIVPDNAVLISAKNNTGIEILKQKIKEMLF